MLSPSCGTKGRYFGGQTGIVLIFGPAIRSTPFFAMNDEGGDGVARKGFIREFAMPTD
jgi:hypothetical protein